MPSKFIVNKLQSLLGSEHLVEAYLNKFGEIVNESYIEQIKNAAAAKKDAAPQANAPSSGDDPVYEMLVQCPACNREDIVSYNLRSKSQVIKETLFLVPQYSQMQKYFAVDFNLLQTTVCPDCLLASPDPRDWSQKSKFTGKITESQLNEHTRLLAEIRNQEQARKTKIPDAKGNPTYFARPRSLEKAIESIELSIMRAEAESKYAVTATDFKLGSYYLKIADIQKKQKKDNTETLKKAEQYFSAAAVKSDIPSATLEMMSIYQVVALNLFLGNKTKAAEFLKITKDALREREQRVKEESTSENKAELTEVQKWEKRISNLWEYRDDADYWKDADA